MSLHPIVEELVALIANNHWQQDFEAAIQNAQRANVAELEGINTLADYLRFVNDFVTWLPIENETGTVFYSKACAFYFVLDQMPIVQHQNRVRPYAQQPELTPLSQWIVRYAQQMGSFMDSPESLSEETLATFYRSPVYNLHEYVQPRGGWKTFNQFFARSVKPGYRPIAAIADPAIITSPADSVFSGQWEIRADSGVTIKGLHWSVEELLAGSPYQHRFANGLFTHAFLSPTDYHRQHAPVDGVVLEARVIPGQAYLQVVAEAPDQEPEPANRRLVARRHLNAPDEAGYQFAQARGLVVFDSPIGLVAVLPIGMAMVSSVVLTAEPGMTLRKGEEISYFQFGGSDVVMLFEACSNVSITAQLGVHYKVGSRIAQAYPVSTRLDHPS
ncbi:MAG: phosphatidylserine decarboxylase [Synechococcaceae cyanobacterium]